MPRPAVIVSNLLGATGAAVGGTIGYFLFSWIADQGFYGIMIPGGMLGFGCGLLARHRSEARGIACGFAALILGLYSEARVFPFNKDSSLDYFFRNLGDLRPVTWLLIILGSLIAYYLARTPGRTHSFADLD